MLRQGSVSEQLRHINLIQSAASAFPSSMIASLDLKHGRPSNDASYCTVPDCGDDQDGLSAGSLSLSSTFHFREHERCVRGISPAAVILDGRARNGAGYPRGTPPAPPPHHLSEYATDEYGCHEVQCLICVWTVRRETESFATPRLGQNEGPVQTTRSMANSELGRNFGKEHQDFLQPDMGDWDENRRR